MFGCIICLLLLAAGGAWAGSLGPCGVCTNFCPYGYAQNCSCTCKCNDPCPPQCPRQYCVVGPPDKYGCMTAKCIQCPDDFCGALCLPPKYIIHAPPDQYGCSKCLCVDPYCTPCECFGQIRLRQPGPDGCPPCPICYIPERPGPN